jgi:hypothetical protein
MNRPSMQQPSDLWIRDGSLRDVYLYEAELKDWRTLLELVRSYEHQYLEDGVQQALPTIESIFANRETSKILRVKIASASVNCHFFLSTEIELDIDPREVIDLTTHEAILLFLEVLSLGTNKRIIVTPENWPESPHLAFNPASQQWHVYEAPSTSSGA